MRTLPDFTPAEVAILLCALDDRIEKYRGYAREERDALRQEMANKWHNRAEATEALRNRISGFVTRETK